VAQSSFPFPGSDVVSVAQQRTYHQFVGDGVTDDTTGLSLLPRGDGTTTVVLPPGAATVRGTKYVNDSDLSLDVAATSGQPAAGQSRIDLAILRWTATGIVAAIKPGTPSVSPARPALTRNDTTWEVQLGRWTYDGGGISAPAVVDERSHLGWDLWLAEGAPLPDSAPVGSFARYASGSVWVRRISGASVGWFRYAHQHYRMDKPTNGVNPRVEVGLGAMPASGGYTGATNGVAVPNDGVYTAALTVNFGSGLAGRSWLQIMLDNASSEANIARASVSPGERLATVAFGPVHLTAGQFFSGVVYHESSTPRDLRVYWRIARIS
jgi:hypothetical protein